MLVRTARLAVLFVTLIAWMGSGVASLVHEATVAHVVCADHGELTELHGDAEARQDRTVATADTPAVHEHGCDWLGMPFPDVARAPALTITAPPAYELPPPPRPGIAAIPARGPPLAFAPKTSPPSLG